MNYASTPKIGDRLFFGAALVACAVFFICCGEWLSALCILPGAIAQMHAYFYPILWPKNPKT
jgi:hypothetical protein